MDARTASWPAICAVVGGALWALTPLRQPLLEAGRSPDEGELVFRGYNLLIVLIAVLLTLALLQMRANTRLGRAALVGWYIILAGHVLLGAGSVPAAVLGAGARGFVSAALDAGFLGAMLAALGAVVLGPARCARDHCRFPRRCCSSPRCRRACSVQSCSGPWASMTTTPVCR